MQGRHCEEKLVRLKNQCFGNRQDAVQQRTPGREPARSEQALQQAEPVGVLNRIQPETTRLRNGFPLLASIALDNSNPMADRPDFGVGMKMAEDRAEFFGGPPVVAIEEGDDLAEGSGDAKIESGGLTAIWF